MSWCCISWKISKEINQNDNIFITVESACLYSSPDAGDDKMEARDKKWSAPSITRACPGALVFPQQSSGENIVTTHSGPWLCWLMWHENGLPWSAWSAHLTTRPIDCQMETNEMMSPAAASPGKHQTDNKTKLLLSRYEISADHPLKCGSSHVWCYNISVMYSSR